MKQKFTQVTRDELYQQVWETPIVKLANQYGISDRGLSKICKRLNIPTPGRGDGARKAAGKHVSQYQLPDPDENTTNEIVIPEYGTLPQPSSETQASLTESIEKSHQLSVPKRLVSPHPVIKAWLEEYNRIKSEEKAEKKRDPFGVHFNRIQSLTTVDRRRHRILHVLFAELQKKGYQVKSERFDVPYLEFKGIRVDFKLREKLKQIRRPLNVEEKSSVFTRHKRYIQELEQTGHLQLSIKTHIEAGLRREWNETTKKSMDEHLPEIIAVLTLAGPILVKKEQEREEEHRRYQEEERKRYERERLQKRNVAQWKHFLACSEAWQQAEVARQFITELEKHIDENDQTLIGERTVEEWLRWTREWVAKTDPLSQHALGIFEEIARVDRDFW